MESAKTVVVTAAMAVCAAAMSSEDVHGPIPVTFSLDRPSRVTLVVEDAKTGLRVRNLVMDEKFPAGKNTAWWDGLDDHSQANVRQHGGYDVAGSLVAPGEYVVRGIAHDEIDIVWQFCTCRTILSGRQTVRGSGSPTTRRRAPLRGFPGQRTKSPPGRRLRRGRIR